MADQIEKVFQKQPIFRNTKACGSKTISTKEKPWYKDVVLGFKTPAAAINGSYIDYLHYIPKHSTHGFAHPCPGADLRADRPAFRVEIGDAVTVGQRKPLSKTVRFNLLWVSKNKAAAASFGKF
ncbi:hypothetical protein B0H19DRAFT_1211277 [Mycena capillaripes]|nr:hypothetical protein B0H19DRAFT_1211277 [Mycena capillaripes]